MTIINIAIPGFYELKELNLLFLEEIKIHPEYFYQNTKISAIYGNPQHCIWDGGRMFLNEIYADKDTIKNLITTYNNIYNLPIRYIFTNNMLEKTDYLDHFCNLITKWGHNEKNEIVISDNNFLEYLRKNYPKYKYISSTTKCLLNKEKIKEELKKDFYLICLDYNLNHNLNHLNNFSEDEKKKIEILLNPICEPGCPYRKEHYKINSIYNLSYNSVNFALEGCWIDNNNKNIINKSHHITRKDIEEKYLPIGITNFKIEGRTWSYKDVLETYLEYFVKPEYHEIVFQEIFKELNENNF